VEEIDAACQDCAVPALLLQPLVENAVKHGVAGMLEGGAIRLAVEQSGGAVAITLENGFDPEMPAPRNLGMGLDHVRRRLEVRYGEEASFHAGVCAGVYRVVLRFPCESPIASSNRA
jgi:LytS/YehU family sensor histidine kinase